MAETTLNRLGPQFWIILGVASSWVLLFRLNHIIFSGFSHSAFSDWIFLPAAIRILSVLLFETPAVIGLAIGALLTRDPSSGELFNLILALLSGLAPYVAIQICRKGLGLSNDLAGLNAKQLGMLALAGATTNSAMLNLFLLVIGHPAASGIAVLAIFVGDMVGTAIILYGAALLAWGLDARRR